MGHPFAGTTWESCWISPGLAGGCAPRLCLGREDLQSGPLPGRNQAGHQHLYTCNTLCTWEILLWLTMLFLKFLFHLVINLNFWNFLEWIIFFKPFGHRRFLWNYYTVKFWQRWTMVWPFPLSNGFGFHLEQAWGTEGNYHLSQLKRCD